MRDRYIIIAINLMVLLCITFMNLRLYKKTKRNIDIIVHKQIQNL